MSDNPKLPKPAQLLRELQTNSELKHRPLATTELDPQLALLREWQSERLKQTYADLLADKRYRTACLFFLSDIYAACDFSQRDYDAERIHAFLSRIVPAPMLQLLTNVIELNRMTDKLDHQLLRVMIDQLHISDKITVEQYTEGYRRCDNYTARSHQIDLITTTIVQVGEGSHLFVVGIALQLLRQPAKAAGWTQLYDFVVRGYDAFRQTKDVRRFAKTIQDREQRILDQIFAGAVDPFGEGVR